MKIYVDQSGKIEDTSNPTILAFTDSRTFSIKITAKTKRQLQEIFRRRGQIRLFVYRAFASLVFLLITKFLREIDQVVIDVEYPGKEKLIKEIILEFLRRKKLKEPSIFFERIGNTPKVHYSAYNVFVKKKKADLVIRLGELKDLAIKNDRGRRGSQTPQRLKDT